MIILSTCTEFGGRKSCLLKTVRPAPRCGIEWCRIAIIYGQADAHFQGAHENWCCNFPMYNLTRHLFPGCVSQGGMCLHMSDLHHAPSAGLDCAFSSQSIVNTEYPMYVSRFTLSKHVLITGRGQTVSVSAEEAGTADDFSYRPVSPTCGLTKNVVPGRCGDLRVRS